MHACGKLGVLQQLSPPVHELIANARVAGLPCHSVGVGYLVVLLLMSSAMRAHLTFQSEPRETEWSFLCISCERYMLRICVRQPQRLLGTCRAVLFLRAFRLKIWFVVRVCSSVQRTRVKKCAYRLLRFPDVRCVRR